MGDFNSNAIWDREHRERNHSVVVQQLMDLGLSSAYHFMNNEMQGEETQKTFYLHRNAEKGYHIDYCFLSPNRLISFEVSDKNVWLEYSDHVPIVVEIS